MRGSHRRLRSGPAREIRLGIDPAPVPGESTEGSEVLSDDTLQRGARTGNVDRVLVTRGKHYAGQLEDRCRGPGNVEVELVGSPSVRCGVEIQVRRRGIHGESGYLLAALDERT